MNVRPSVLLCLLAAACAPAADLRVRVHPVFGGEPVGFDLERHVTPAAQTVSVTRIDFLVSDAMLRRADGEWLGADNWQAYAGLRDGRDTFRLGNVPAGSYDRLRFHIGLDPARNHADPAGFAADHPLNPNLNGLHWNWAGGYVFLALEGRWRDAGDTGGYSYHLATDRLRMTVELPVALDLRGDRQLDLTLDVARVLGDLRIREDTSSTHSREGDALAERLARAAETAFAVRGVGPLAAEAAPARAAPAGLPPGVTPYRFTYSAFFPKPALPRDNPLTEEGVRLGHDLFLEPLLSRNDALSCASCHQPSAWFSDPRRFSPGVDRIPGTRQSMPLFNLAWKNAFFWDGRAPTLRAQVLEPIQNPVEMHETLENVEAKLAAHPDYPARFAAVFGSPGVTRARVALALEQFLLTLVSHDAKFDRVLRREAEFTPLEQRGFELFHQEHEPRTGQRGADCFHCHGGPFLTNHGFANNGLDADPAADPGRAAVTGRPGDLGKFSTPSLRNIVLTAPYMHDGRFQTLEEVVEHYDHGLRRGPTLDPNLAKHPAAGLGLTEEDKRALVAFLHTLTDEVRFRVPPAGE